MSIRSIAVTASKRRWIGNWSIFAMRLVWRLNWMHYCALIKARSNWVKYAAHPFGDQVWFDKMKSRTTIPARKKFEQSAADHKLWADLRKGRSGFADPAHPFLHQGSAEA